MKLTKDFSLVERASRFASAEYDKAFDLYNQRESEYLQNPDIREELETAGSVRIRTVQKALGISEGEAAFIVRQLNKSYGDEQKRRNYEKSQVVPDTDEFYYHVTLKSKVRGILSQGLRPGSKPMFRNYTHHSSGKTFLCEKNGVPFWEERIETHTFDNTGGTPKLAVLRIPKKAVKEVSDDPVGTSDSRYPSYYTTQAIPGNVIQMVS